jgi:hypothetical protein
MADPINWHCPYCQHKVTITDDLRSAREHYLLKNNAGGDVALQSVVYVCPNTECRQATWWVQLYKAVNVNGTWCLTTKALKTWTLLPASNARPFPEYVPKAIREDYEEACLIRELSPKAAATLARRALQGILRGFYKVDVKGGRLVDEINALKDTMEPELWAAIDSVRKVGNIGAHMEKDIDLIVEVDSDEAQLLIGLVETMIVETYVHRAQRQARLKGVTDLAAEKELARRPQAVPAQLESAASTPGAKKGRP